MQDLDAQRRAAILRGQTPPPLPEEEAVQHGKRRDDRSHPKKRRKLAGEDDTDMDIRLAKSVTTPRENDDANTKILRLRNTESDAPLTNHAGNIDLFPVNMKEAIKRERNMEAEKEKKQKERALEDQYTMRFSNAAGFKTGLSQPWYAAAQESSSNAGDEKDSAPQHGFESKDVWGNEDPRRKEREMTRLVSNDPFASMQRAQAQLKKSREDRKRWANERNQELRELRADAAREDERKKRRRRNSDEHTTSGSKSVKSRHNISKDRSSRHDHRHSSPNRSHGQRHDTKKRSVRNPQ